MLVLRCLYSIAFCQKSLRGEFHISLHFRSTFQVSSGIINEAFDPEAILPDADEETLQIDKELSKSATTVQTTSGNPPKLFFYRFKSQNSIYKTLTVDNMIEFANEIKKALPTNMTAGRTIEFRIYDGFLFELNANTFHILKQGACFDIEVDTQDGGILIVTLNQFKTE